MASGYSYSTKETSVTCQTPLTMLQLRAHGAAVNFLGDFRHLDTHGREKEMETPYMVPAPQIIGNEQQLISKLYLV